MRVTETHESDSMNLTAGQIGLTPEGLGWATILAQAGIKMFCTDPDEEIVNGILDEVMPGEMPGLAEYTAAAVKSGNLKLLGNARRVFKDCRVIFVNSVLPLDEDHLPKLRFIETIIRQAAYQVPKDTVLVIRSLLPEEAVVSLQYKADELTAEREERPKITLCVMPDYRIAGNWLKHMKNRSLLTVGCQEEMPQPLKEILSCLPKSAGRIKSCSIGEAVMSAYGYNGLAVLRQTYLEELERLCIKKDISPYSVRALINTLPNADAGFDNTGAGYGGSIYTERMLSLQAIAKKSKGALSLCRQVSKSRDYGTKALIGRLKREIHPKGKKLAVLGLAPFGDTDDLRNTPALEVVRALITEGADIQLYMSCGINQAKWRFYKEREKVSFCKTALEAAKGADAVLILGKWKNMHRLPSKTLAKNMRGDIVFDIVCGLNPAAVTKCGLQYRN